MIKYVNDIAGIRIICSFTTDIYRIAEMLERQTDMNIISVKDYIKKPKASGYKSYHMIVSIPIYLSEKRVDAKVEIQIRTVAMDFWASGQSRSIALTPKGTDILKLSQESGSR